MSVSENLKQLIDRAKEVLDKDPAHDLPLGLRKKIWVEMEQENEQSVVALALKTVEHVIPLWEKDFSDIDTATRAIELAKIAPNIDNLPDQNSAMNLADNYWEETEYICKGANNNKHCFVGYAASKAIKTAITGNEVFDIVGIDPQEKDHQELKENDPSFFAAVALANGRVEDPQSDPQKRLEFWQWYLNEAIPSAMG